MAQKHYRRAAVEEITGLSCSTIYDMMRKGTFPRPVKLTDKIVAWPDNVLTTWLDARKQVAE